MYQQVTKGYNVLITSLNNDSFQWNLSTRPRLGYKSWPCREVGGCFQRLFSLL